MARYYAIVPAAGSGSRFGASTPKQYLPLLGRPLIWHTLAALCSYPAIDRVWVVISPEDEFWPLHDWLDLGPKLEMVACGGETRAESVRNGLEAAITAVAPEDWVLVHDAARPCLSHAMLDALVTGLADDPVGGLLAVPVADTLKRATHDLRVAETLPRDGLWQAQTPQMFRYALLQKALEEFPGVTDEAGAVEAAGFHPRLVKSGANNLKVTYPSDLRLAEWILRAGELKGE